MGGEEEHPVAWLRRRIQERLYLARHAIELGNAAGWHEQSSGVLVTGEPTETDVWHGTWPMGDSSLTRLMEANDPQDTIARCEAELAILDACALSKSTEVALEAGDISAEEYVTGDVMGSQIVRLLASGYRHRPGYREEWIPTPRSVPAGEA
jgi:hypothetical protein